MDWSAKSPAHFPNSGAAPRAASNYNDSLLFEFQLERIQVVLVSPRNPLNIGAAARAMANFGIRRLAVVAPHEAHWREAKSAVGAPDLLADARETGTLAEAISNCTFVIGTGTLAHRKPEEPAVALPDLAPIVRRELAGGGQVAVVFGSEKRGLTGEDLSHCHLLVEIPTDPRQPSMNLGQAVAVCLYALSTRVSSKTQTSGALDLDFETRERVNPDGPPATSGDLDLLAEVIEKTMRAANYSPSVMQDANRHDTRVLLRRLTLTRRDTRRILGLFRRILWRLTHNTGDSHQ